MARIDVPGGDELYAWLGLSPDMGAALGGLSAAVYERSRLPLRVREVARYRIALDTGCMVCLNARDAQGPPEGIDETFYANVAVWRESDAFSERERLAAEFADRFAGGHVELASDDDFFVRLRRAFSDDEIVDLGVSLALWLGSGRLMKVLDVAQSCQLTLNEDRAATTS